MRHVLRRRRLKARTPSGQVRFEALVAGMADAILVTDRGGRVRYASPATTSMLGIAPEHLLGRDLDEAISEDGRVVLPALAKRALQEPVTSHAARVVARSANGQPVHLEVVVHQVANGVVAGLGVGRGTPVLVWTVRDVTGAHAMEQRLRRLAFYDQLTGLPNRVLLVDRTEQALGRRGAGRRPVVLMIFDFDRFRDVLDVRGRAVGDQILLEAADRLRAGGPAGQMLARLGGNSFAVVREDLDGASAAVEEARALLSALARPIPVAGTQEGLEHTVACSAGVALADDLTDAETLLRDAHTALHAVKVRGGRNVLLFEQSMHARAAERLEIASGLGNALRDGQLELVYQPVVDLLTGHVTGVEALLRWRHPRLGRLQPDVFVSLAEEGGTIAGIGAWAVHEACRQAADWRTRLGPRMPSTVAVNLSPLQLASRDLLSEVASALSESGLDPARLVLEITEGVLIDDMDLAARRLEALKGLGVRLAIDDFGVGYSSLSYLPRLPVDILKVDGSFLDCPDEAVLRSICSLGASLGLRTVAEGVETAGHARLLRDVGCDAAQGFLFAPPIPAIDVEPLLGVVLDAVPAADPPRR